MVDSKILRYEFINFAHPHIIHVLFIPGRAPGYDSFVESEGP